MEKNTFMFFKYIGQPYLPLYKYYSNYDFAEDAIINQRIHLEHPSDYNDLYDSFMRVTSGEYLKNLYNLRKYLSKKLIVNLDSKYHGLLDSWRDIDPNNHASVYSFYEYAIEQDATINKKELLEHCINAVSDQGLVRSQNVKVSCFSERKDSLLMWAYYAKNYTGVCLEFDAKSDPMLNKFCSKVQYSHTIFCDENPESKFDDNYFIKSYEWSHEQEWRLVTATEEEYFPTKSLRSIVLGAKIPTDQLRRFIDLGTKYNLNVYRVFPDKQEFKLLFTQLVVREG